MIAETPSRVDEMAHNVHLIPIMTTASTPATPGPSTPTTVRTMPIERVKVEDSDGNIIPPARPKSTPFPQQEALEGDILCLQRHTESDRSSAHAIHAPQSTTLNSPLYDLPVEIHECILDHLFGVRASASSRTPAAGKSKALRSWGTALRHSRRREVSELALVNTKWREIVQDRLYRHLKIKGTRESVDRAILWFHSHSHLCPYVKHIEVWFPVFQQKNPAFDRTLQIPLTHFDRSTMIRSLENLSDIGNSVTYQSPSNNCTLEEVFGFVQMTFAEACILTLEGGERKKPPMVQHFADPELGVLPIIHNIKILVCKGQWNLIRSDGDFHNIANALPNLTEWHSVYAKPKSKSYISMATILPKLPHHLTHLNVCIEADYRRENVAPSFFRKVGAKTHLCIEMAKAIPTLEHLAYTGRVCRHFFDNAAKLSKARDSRLRSVDLVVKNICRPESLWNDGSGITDIEFITAFETLIISGIKALDRLAVLDFLRVRFIDLESQIPALNPYFQLSKNECTGIWSDIILEHLARTRPTASFLEKSEMLGDIIIKDGQLLGTPTFSKTKPLSIKVSSYSALTSGITIT